MYFKFMKTKAAFYYYEFIISRSWMRIIFKENFFRVPIVVIIGIDFEEYFL